MWSLQQNLRWHTTCASQGVSTSSFPIKQITFSPELHSQKSQTIHKALLWFYTSN